MTEKDKPAPPVEFDMDGSAGWSKDMDEQTTEFLCTVEWSWSPNNERMESYYLERSPTHWILWRKPYDDNNGQWEDATAIARCPQGLLQKDAAMVLLPAVLAEGLRRYDPDLDRFHGVADTGLLSIEDLDAVADTVWGHQG